MHSDLRQLQNKILELVEYFDAFCAKYNIEYYLMGGTALGAVRHKGFIPWDDDFDVFMDKENYNKFRNIIREKLDKKKYYFQDENSSENPLFFCKLRMNNTALIEIDTQSRIMHQGIFLDIMPLDNASDNLFVRYIQYVCARTLSARTLGEKGYITSSLLKRVLIFLAKLIITTGVKSKLKSIIENSNRKETKMIGFFFGRTKYRNMFFPQKFLKEIKTLDFEKFSLPVFEKVEKYLKITFGNDFMRIPTKKERDKYPQHAFLFDVNKSYKYYLNGLENWRKYNGVILPNMPPHIEINDSIQSIQKYIKSNNVWFARWVSDFDVRKETKFWYVICDNVIPIDKLSKNTRHNVTRGLKRCEVKKVTCQFILENAYPVYLEAFDNYTGYLKPNTESEFLNEYSLYNDESIWDFWAVFEKKSSKLIAFARNKIEYKQCELCTAKFHPKYQRKYYPSEALFYIMNNYYLNKKRFKYINNGSRSVSHDTKIQSFLIKKFGFRKSYCKMNILYSPFVAVAIKFIYPFKFFIMHLNNNFANKLQVLIRHEEIRRSFYRNL